MTDKKMYAAYGSNLHTAQMSVRCPDAEVYGKAELKDYELVFRKNPKYAVANMEPRAGSAVPVLLWKSSRQDEAALDQYDCWPSLYKKETLRFQMRDQTVPAMVYTMTARHLPGIPLWSYIRTLAAGYRECGFDVTVLKTALDRSEELLRQEQPDGQFVLEF